MNYYIKNIHVNHLYHLHDFDIPLSDEKTPHLMLTGKNGSGKTVLLNAIASYLNRRKDEKSYVLDIDINFVDFEALLKDYQKGNFIIAFYQAARKTQMIEPKNPTKPKLKVNGDVRSTVTNQFLNFLSDLKIQEALARNAQQFDDAEQIAQWFVSFEELLRQIPVKD